MIRETHNKADKLMTAADTKTSMDSFYYYVLNCLKEMGGERASDVSRC